MNYSFLEAPSKQEPLKSNQTKDILEALGCPDNYSEVLKLNWEDVVNTEDQNKESYVCFKCQFIPIRPLECVSCGAIFCQQCANQTCLIVSQKTRNPLFKHMIVKDEPVVKTEGVTFCENMS